VGSSRDGRLSIRGHSLSFKIKGNRHTKSGRLFSKLSRRSWRGKSRNFRKLAKISKNWKSTWKKSRCSIKHRPEGSDRRFLKWRPNFNRLKRICSSSLKSSCNRK
jgi:hypothetical protein